MRLPFSNRTSELNELDNAAKAGGYPNATRYWEKDLEFDLVRTEQGNPEKLIVSEVKWRNISAREESRLIKQLEDKWRRCALSKRYPAVGFELIDAKLLERL